MFCKKLWPSPAFHPTQIQSKKANPLRGPGLFFQLALVALLAVFFPGARLQAQTGQITGTVVLKVVFSSGGQVTNIRTVSGLPNGLTERAIAAARQIKFVPATKDGHQVSMWMQLEYNFNLY